LTSEARFSFLIYPVERLVFSASCIATVTKLHQPVVLFCFNIPLQLDSKEMPSKSVMCFPMMAIASVTVT
jgi:hypothetical protein